MKAIGFYFTRPWERRVSGQKNISPVCQDLLTDPISFPTPYFPSRPLDLTPI